MSSSTRKITALSVAEYFIGKANEGKKPITNKKLQKLVYYAQAWSLALKNKELFDEKIEAWVHGPAIKSVYAEFKNFGFNKIEKEIDLSLLKNISAETQELLDSVWAVYGELDADYLEMLTHSEAPWQEAREGLQSSENSENAISLETMKVFYRKKLAEAKS